MEFCAYPKILHTKMISESEIPDELFCVTEKVHGANLQITTDGKSVVLGKRSAFLTDKEYSTFFKAEVIREKFSQNVLALFTLLGASKTLAVFGEIFGGYYPGHPRKMSPVQKGIWYTNGIEFYAFDISVDGKFLDYEITVDQLKKHEFLMAEPEFIGTLKECLQFSENSYRSASSLPRRLGQAEIKDNFREGNVIRSMKGHILFKHVNPKFREFPVAMPKIENELKNYMTQQRYDSAISKLGPDVKKDVLLQYLVEDAMADYEPKIRKMLSQQAFLLFQKNQQS